MIEGQSLMKSLARPESEFIGETASGEKMKFRIIHWTPTKTFSRIALVGKYFAVPVSMLGNANPDDGSFSELLPAALLQLFNTMEEHDFCSFIATVLDEVYYENANVVENFDKVFLGKNELVIQLISKVLEVNYAPFFKTGFANLMTSIVPVTSLAKTK